MNINEPNKVYSSPAMHTAEHILNSQMVKYFHCERAFSAHIEKKKSKCDYYFTTSPTPEDIATVEQAVNDIIQQNINVEEIFYPKDKVPSSISIERLPDPSVDTVRVIRIGDYDQCACIGEHVTNTAEIGTFRIISHDFNEGVLRVRFKVSSLIL
ncbi:MULTISPECIES: hypothetical protein [unclassified Butyricimonas]|nr:MULTISPECIES: hypothetical protein [unclassified Butyricimonas]